MENLNLSNSSENLDYNDIQKMIFIGNALNDGWTIRKLSKDKYELIKNKQMNTKYLEVGKRSLKQSCFQGGT